MFLVTGGAGFIGSHIADELLAEGRPVRILDLLLPGAHAAPPAYLPSEAELVVGDVRDESTVERCLEGVTAVCHQAAMVGLGTDASDVEDYVSHNDLGTAVLLRALARRPEVERLVLASSMVVYGEGRYHCSAHGPLPAPARLPDELRAGRFEPTCPECGAPLAADPVTEEAPLDPRNVYAATKVHQEHLCAWFARETGVPVTALRYHNVYGPRMPRDTPYSGVAAIFASALAAGRAPRVFEDGGQMRDFVHVRDVARANVRALLAPQPIPGVFNIASGHPRTVGEMAGALADAAAAGAPRPVVTGEWRLGDVRHVFASTTFAKDVLGFEAQEDFAAGMAELRPETLRSPATEPSARAAASGEGGAAGE